MSLVRSLSDFILQGGSAGAQRLLKQLSGGAQNLGRNAENVIMGGPLPLATPTPNPRRLLPDVPRRSPTVTPADIQRADQIRQIVPTVRAREALPNISGPRQGVTLADRELANQIQQIPASFREATTRRLLPNMPGPRQGVTSADRELADRLGRGEISIPSEARRLLPSTVTPADIQRAERELADRLVQGEISVPPEDAAALFDRLRGQAPVVRDIPTSVPDYLQGTFLRPGPGEIAGQARLRYRPGTPGVGGTKLGNKTYGTAAEADLLQGPVPPPNRLNLDEMRAQERLARQMEFEQGIPISRPGEVRGRSFFTEPDPFTGRIEIDPRINPYPTSRVVLDTAGNVVEDISPLAARPSRPKLDIVKSYPKSQMGPFPADAVVDPVTKATRNATGGIQMGDLNTLIDVLRNNPIRSVGALGGAGLTGLGLSSVIGNMMRGDEGSAPLDLQGETRTLPGEPVVTPNGINQPEQPPVLFADNDGTPLGSVGSPEQSQPMPRRSDPTAPAPVITRGGDRASEMREQLAQYSPRAAAVDRAMEPRSPERYKSAEDYYAARAAYANQAPVRQSLMKYAEGTGSSPAESTALRTWAQSYPALAYEMQRRSMVNPEANQQTQQSVTTTTITTPMGTNNQANAIGNAEATAQSAVAPTQGSFDLRSATTPMEQPVLTPAEEFLQRLSVPQRDQMMYY